MRAIVAVRLVAPMAPIIRGRVYTKYEIMEFAMTFKKTLFAGVAAVIIGAPVMGPALAQETREQVIVVAPFSKHENSMPLKGGMKTQTLIANRVVTYNDLDLTRAADRERLTHRITIAARNACHDLDAHFPQTVYVPVSDNENCVGNARREALAMVDFRDTRHAPDNYGYFPE
jgi:UrcA family protein